MFAYMFSYRTLNIVSFQLKQCGEKHNKTILKQTLKHVQFVTISMLY